VSVGRIPPHEAQELEACFRAHAGYLFGRAQHADLRRPGAGTDLVQAAFEAAAMNWQALRGLAEEQRRNWLPRNHGQHRGERLSP